MCGIVSTFLSFFYPAHLLKILSSKWDFFSPNLPGYTHAGLDILPRALPGNSAFRCAGDESNNFDNTFCVNTT